MVEPSDAGIHLPSLTGIPAAQYVRMSTDQQRYSAENQKSALSAYASANGLRIVRTYEDLGRSGLTLHGRDGLRTLLTDVLSNSPEFRALLVYDVSRWGRFQDADESAYYEYLCRRAGVHVIYCAEPFENDGSAMSTVFKSIKRVMAAEFSRELSTKIFIGQHRLAERGLKMGGRAPYGLRRLLIDHRGKAIGILEPGERKSIVSEHVVLVPGSEEEVAVVRRIFRRFVTNHMSTHAIATELNGKGLVTRSGIPWSGKAVEYVLNNEAYSGDYVWNHATYKLKRPRRANPPEAWVRASGVIEPIVAPTLFDRAQDIIRQRMKRRTNEDLINELRDLYRRKGRLSKKLIDAEPGMANSSTYHDRFGSLPNAFALAGYKPTRDYSFLTTRPDISGRVVALVAEVAGALKAHRVRVKALGKARLLLNRRTLLQVRIARYRTTPAGTRQHWQCVFRGNPDVELTLVARLGSDNATVLDYYILPADLRARTSIRFGERNSPAIDQFRFDELGAALAAAAQVVQPASRQH